MAHLRLQPARFRGGAGGAEVSRPATCTGLSPTADVCVCLCICFFGPLSVSSHNHCTASTRTNEPWPARHGLLRLAGWGPMANGLAFRTGSVLFYTHLDSPPAASTFVVCIHVYSPYLARPALLCREALRESTSTAVERSAAWLVIALPRRCRRLKMITTAVRARAVTSPFSS